MNQKRTARQFDGWAKSRMFGSNWQHGFSNRGVLQGLELSGGERVLDVGCATGRLLKRLGEKYLGLELFGVDISTQMVNKAKLRLGEKARIVRASAIRLPYSSNSFDVVTCASSFHHYDDPRLALMEMYRVLKPGGKLILLDVFVDGRWRQLVAWGLNTVFNEEGVRMYTKQKLEQMLELTGFKQIEQKTYLKYKLITMATKKRVNNGAS